MVFRTTHVIPVEDGWIVKKSGRAAILFPTRKEAVDRAVRLSKAAKAAQVVVHSPSGLFRVVESHGLRKRKRKWSPDRSTLGRKAIRRAVGQTIVERLLAE
jgi:hypothetical protein